MINRLNRRIWDRSEFQDEYRFMLRYSLRETLGIGEPESDDPSSQEMEDMIVRLLQSASSFAISDVLDHQRAAFRIAANSYVHFQETFDNVSAPASLIFDRLGNFPSSELVTDLEGDSETEWSLPLWFESQAKKVSNAKSVGNGGEESSDETQLILTDFQKSLWDSLEAGRSVSISAPTSSGKSYVLYNYIVQRVSNESHFCAVYVVPTRALIAQVSNDLKTSIVEYGLEGITVSGVPIGPDEFDDSKLLYVLTQERLQKLLDNNDEVEFDLVVADEAQSIQDGSRGVVFQSAIESVADRSSSTQFMFASPLADNPEFFGEIFSIANLDSRNERESPVSQNLIFVTKVQGRQKTYALSARLDDTVVDIGEVKVENPFSGNPRTLANMAWEFGKDEPSLVYYGAPAGCENIASYIDDLLEDTRRSSEELSEFADFIADQIHPDFTLVRTLRQGIGFHYGNLPTPIRQGIESLFKSGQINYLVATSTLLQGVNLPAKNLFLCNPRKGRVEPLQSTEFWNLAGRAGRLREDFEGNIFLIEVDDWKDNPLDGPKKESISSSTADYLSDTEDDILDYISDDDIASGQNQGFENTFTKLIIAEKENRLSTEIEKYDESLTEGRKAHLTRAIESAAPAIELPPDVLSKSRSLSPYRQQELFDNLAAFNSQVGRLTDLIPPHPNEQNAWGKLNFILSLIQRTVEKSEGEQHRYYATLSLQWMEGLSYREIIRGAVNINEKRPAGEQKSLNTVIRNVLKTVNNDLRYRFVKFFGCYNALLTHLIDSENLDADAASIPDLPLYLEIGASSKTMISLISVGLSRMTASLLEEQAPSEGYDRREAKQWLDSRPLETFDLPPVCLSEVRAARS